MPAPAVPRPLAPSLPSLTPRPPPRSDHGNREVRASARLKYLVHTLGIDSFRTLVEDYHGKPIEPWAPLPPWKYLDWMGWHEQGDGKLMLGINVVSGRISDTPEVRLKTVLRVLVDRFDLDMILTASQSIVLRNINPVCARAAVEIGGDGRR